MGLGYLDLVKMGMASKYRVNQLCEIIKKLNIFNPSQNLLRILWKMEVKYVNS